MLDRIYQSLGGKKLSENKYMLHCPSHDDTNPSLSVTRQGSNILFHCFAGCSFEEVRNALNSKGINVRNQRLVNDSNKVMKRGKTKKTTIRVRLISNNRRAEELYTSSRVAMKHPYLEHKGIRPHDVRIREGCLLIPMRDGQGM